MLLGFVLIFTIFFLRTLQFPLPVNIHWHLRNKKYNLPHTVDQNLLVTYYCYNPPIDIEQIGKYRYF